MSANSVPFVPSCKKFPPFVCYVSIVVKFAPILVGAWSLNFLWCLDVGIWSFAPMSSVPLWLKISGRPQEPPFPPVKNSTPFRVVRG